MSARPVEPRRSLVGAPAGRPVVGVLALQGDVREHLAALAEVGADPRPVRRPEELDAVEGLVVPGGESTTISRLARVFDLLEPVRHRIAGGMPVFGSCAGMILLAETVLDGRPDQESFGGIDMVVRRNAFGRQVDSFETDLDVDGVRGGPVHAVFIRAPWVERVGPGVRVLARVAGADAPGGHRDPGGGHDRSDRPDGRDGRIVAVRQGPLLATSFHPELTGDARVHGLFVAMVADGRRSRAASPRGAA